MIRLEFLLEEPSMENVLKILLPKILPAGYKLNQDYFLRPHSGKSDLQKSIPNKMKGFRSFPGKVLFVILHDQDSNDCLELKKELTRLCQVPGGPRTLIRIVCRELESWYLGDMDAIEKAYPKFKADQYKKRSKFRNPELCNASDELEKLIPGFQKGTASQTIPKHFDILCNKSTSFHCFISGLQRLLENPDK